MPSSRERRNNARRGASDADIARVATETDRRAQELGAAMLNAARPYMDVNLDKQGLPVAVTPRDFFAFLEALTTYNNRTPAMKDKALVLEGMSSRVVDFCTAFPSLRFKPQEEEDDGEQQTLLEYDSEWDPKTEAGREKCLEYDANIIIPALRKQFTFKNGKTEHEAVRDMLKSVVPKKDGTDWAQMRMLIKAFLERREQESGGESSEADDLQLIKWVLEAIKPNWPHLYEWMKKLPKKDQHTNVIEMVDEMAEMSENFMKMANGAMQDYTRFLTEKSEKSTGKDNQAQDSVVKSSKQGVRSDNNAAETSKAGKDTKKRHDPHIVCLRCDEPGHIARYCTNKGKPAVTYPRPVSQQGDRGGDRGSERGKGKVERKGSVAAAVAAETTEDEYRDFQRFQEWKASSSNSTRRK